ncbi:peptidoglycan DD-metalloendopeptidase family protein [Aquitalea aquatica]|uniref:Peptidoglycan DD-metalloendopeptidase family protein n=1 Tax=Aquitalea aquatica TaxID=3044273 RepID=A0A838Y8T0_9NEIS|nr:peptidoglycan DD-metalloendopeptidase family protein [Aquitalea magnusonii]MBA4708969.1 peptidoglycan DD-metalloendopeptidase family protein [Aquitalea magnusonii]
MQSLLRLCGLLLILVMTACSTLPDYPPAPAGFYRVQPGDTLYRIALKHRQSVGNLVSWNQLKDPSSINAGQLLRISPQATSSTQAKPPVKPAPSTPARPAASAIALQWPATGQVIGKFNGSSNKGIDIAGKAGDPVRAAASGTVAYAGKGIRAYGNLLIIKHGNDYLTAYAHNQTLLVKEGQAVKAGQQIATLGRSGSTRDMLHFELRRQGKAIDPLSALPAQ